MARQLLPLLLLLTLLPFAAAVYSDDGTTCKWTAPDGQHVDLSSMTKTAPDYYTVSVCLGQSTPQPPFSQVVARATIVIFPSKSNHQKQTNPLDFNFHPIHHHTHTTTHSTPKKIQKTLSSNSIYVVKWNPALAKCTTLWAFNSTRIKINASLSSPMPLSHPTIGPNCNHPTTVLR